MEVGGGTLALSGTAANANLATVVVAQGTLQLAKNAAVVAVVNGGNIVVNSGATLAAAPSVTSLQTAGFIYDNQINADNIEVMSGGTVNLNGMAATVNSLMLFGGATVNTGGGLMTLNTNVYVPANTTPATISGEINLTNGGHTFWVSDNPTTPGADQLIINAGVTGGGLNTNVVNKSGTGVMVLDNVDGYSGTTIVNQGILDVRNSLALGVADGTISTAVTVNSGATLKLNPTADAFVSSSSLTITNKLLILNSSGGMPATGEALSSSNNSVTDREVALDNVSGSNTWLGNIILANPNWTVAGDDVAVKIGANTSLNLAGSVSQGGLVMQNGGVGAIGVYGNGGVFGLPGAVPVGLTMIGQSSSSLQLSGTAANTYLGTTTVTGGTLTLNKTAGVNAIGGNLVIGDPLAVPLSAAIATSPTGAVESTGAGTVSTATWAANVATITTTASHNLAVGQVITITGMTPAAYNGTYVVASVPTGTTFTYLLPLNPGTYASGGAVVQRK